MIRLLVGSARITVGLLFIISGLIKLNDPVGFGFKLEEYFSPG
ncbi:MAG: DoxX family protein, partial [Marinirhabdus sp.]